MLTMADAHPRKIFGEAVIAALGFLVPMIDSEAHGPFLFATENNKLLSLVVAPLGGSVLSRKAAAAVKRPSRKSGGGSLGADAPASKKLCLEKAIEPKDIGTNIEDAQMLVTEAASAVSVEEVASGSAESATVPKVKKATAAAAGKTLKLQLKVSSWES